MGRHSLIIHKRLMVFMKTDKTIILQKKMLIVFDEIIADKEANKNLSPIVTELFLKGKKLSISLDFIPQCFFKVPKTIRLNTTHYLVMKIPNKRELQ